MEDKLKYNFAGLSTASSFVRKVKGVIDSRTNKTMMNVMWPPIKKTKKIPFSQPIPNGFLNNLQFLVYDEATTSLVIKMERDQFHIVDPRDLLRLGEHDIHTLTT